MRFDSKKELRRWQELKLLKAAGEVVMVLRQTRFDLPGRTKYLCDFTIFWADGRVTFEDVKGVRTETYRLKKRQVEELYPVEIEEV
jgi:hypothetical protein